MCRWLEIEGIYNALFNYHGSHIAFFSFPCEYTYSSSIISGVEGALTLKTKQVGV
jgi:hypothetical protein